MTACEVIASQSAPREFRGPDYCSHALGVCVHPVLCVDCMPACLSVCQPLSCSMQRQGCAKHRAGSRHPEDRSSGNTQKAAGYQSCARGERPCHVLCQCTNSHNTQISHDMGDTSESHTGPRSCKCPLMLSFTAGGGFKQEQSSQRECTVRDAASRHRRAGGRYAVQSYSHK